MNFILKVQWQSEQEKQESKSIYATEESSTKSMESKPPAIEVHTERKEEERTIATAWLRTCIKWRKLKDLCININSNCCSDK